MIKVQFIIIESSTLKNPSLPEKGIDSLNILASLTKKPYFYPSKYLLIVVLTHIGNRFTYQRG